MGRRPKWHFPKEDIQMAKRYMKRCSILLVIREIQIKITMRCHLTLIRMANIKKSTNNKCWRGWRENVALLHCWWERKLVQSQWRTVWRFLKNLKIELPYDPAIPFLGIYLDKTIIWKDTYTLIFIAILFTIARSWKQHNCPSTEEWIKKARYIHRMEYHSVIKKGQNNTICSNMDGPEDCHIEWSKADFRFHWKVFNVPLTGTLVLYLLQKRRNSIEGITHFSAISSPVILIYVKQFKGQWVGRRKGFKLYNVKWKSHFACVL